MQNTTITDAFDRSVCFSNNRILATSMAGLLPIAYIVDKLGLLSPASQVLAQRFPSRRNTLFSAADMFRQRLFGLAAGYEDLNDHDSLGEDPGFVRLLAWTASPDLPASAALKIVSTVPVLTRST